MESSELKKTRSWFRKRTKQGGWSFNVARYLAVLLIGLVFSNKLLAVPINLYLTTNTLELTAPAAGLPNIDINEGVTYDWVGPTPNLPTEITVDSSSGVIPVTLVVGLTGPGNLRDFDIFLISSDGAVGTFASLSLTNEDLSTIAARTYNLTLTTPGTDVVLPAGSTITLRIVNNSTGNGQRRVRITPNGSFVVLPSSDLTVLKSVAVISDPINGTTNPKAIPGATMRYTITVQNTSATDATSVVIVDDLPANTTYVAASITLDTVAQTDASDSPTDESDWNVSNAGSVTVTVPTLAVSATATITFDVTID